MIRRLFAAPVTALRGAYADLTEQPRPPAPRALADLDRRFADLGAGVIPGKNVRSESPETTLLRIVPVKNVIPIHREDRCDSCQHPGREHEVTYAGKTFHVCDGCRPIYIPDAGYLTLLSLITVLSAIAVAGIIGAARTEHVFAWLADHPISRNGLYGAVIAALLLAVAYAAAHTFVQRGNAEADVAIAQAEGDKWPAGKGAGR